MRMPRYPIYIPTKGRADRPYTINTFREAGVPIKIVVEPGQVKSYEKIGKKDLLVLPADGKGLVYSRNWIKDHAISEGYAKHWQFDDDIEYISRVYRGYRLRCPPNVALSVIEDFVERYENVKLASLNSEFFIPCNGVARVKQPPFYLNQRCYTCFLMDNALPNRWRYRYNEDTDMTLQVLADGWCTILFNAFLIKTKATMGSQRGGQVEVYSDDGRLKMSRELERVWPRVIRTSRRFGRPQHRVKDEWRKFDTPLIRRKDIDWEAIQKKGNDEHGLELVSVDKVKSKGLQKLFKQTQREKRRSKSNGK